MNTGIRLLVFLSIAILSSSYEIHIKNSNSTLNIQIYGQDGGVLLSNKEIGASQSISGTLRIPQDVYGCNITETFSETDIVLVLRGNCEFATKAKNVQQAHAQAILIGSTIDALYNYTDGYVTDVCNLDCSTPFSVDLDYTQEEMSLGFPESECATSSSCSSHLCGVPYVLQDATQQTICCFKDYPIPMTTETSKYVDIYAFSVRIQDQLKLTDFENEQVTISRYVASKESAQSTLFIFVILLIELCIIPLAYYLSETLKIMFTHNFPSSTNNELTFDMSTKDAIWLLCGSFIILLVLYFCVLFIKGFVVGLMTIIVTIYSVFTLYYILSYYLHKWSVMKVFLFRVPPPLPTNPEDLEKLYQRNSRLINIVHDFFVYMDLGDFINICINATLILCWLCTSASLFHYVVVDIIGIILLLDILMLLRIPSLKVATVMFAVFFIYDVVMVFFTPYIFGDSVMVSVATSLISPSTTSATVTENGIRTCTSSSTYSLPLALIFVFFNGEGANMLGLGDLAIPGIVLFFLFSFDMDRKSHYFGYGMIGYFIGISLASIYSSTYGPQPALLYLCPSILLCVIFAALWNGDVHKLWNPKKFQVRQGPIEIKETVVPDLDV